MLLKLLNLKKKYEPKDYTTREGYFHINTNPKILSFVLIDEFKLSKEIYFRGAYHNKFGLISKVLHQEDLELLEGDVINIETIRTSIEYNNSYIINYVEDMLDELQLEKLQLEAKDFSKIMFETLFKVKKFLLDFTFLIELDPL